MMHGHITPRSDLILCQLELTLDDVKWAIVNAKKLKIKQEV
jgi:hypothetical protein